MLRIIFTSPSIINKCIIRRHSKSQHYIQSNMKIDILSALSDNYMYLLTDTSTLKCAAIDPVEPEKVLQVVKQQGLTLESILTTHHHVDHAGGNIAMTKLCPGLRVYGGDDRIQALTDKVSDGDEIDLGELKLKCLFTPCHTLGHICYFVPSFNNQSPAVFTGDTLFVGGCGRFFEGNPSQMYDALLNKLAKLPKDTRVFCGHEYTINNLKFALHLEPGNNSVKEKLAWAVAKRDEGSPTIPSIIGEELLFNPFMRVCENSMKNISGLTDPVAVMGDIRNKKDNFSI